MAAVNSASEYIRVVLKRGTSADAAGAARTIKIPASSSRRPIGISTLVFDNLRGDHKDHLGFRRRGVRAAEELPENRDISQQRHFQYGRALRAVDQPAEHDRLAVRDGQYRVRIARVDDERLLATRGHRRTQGADLRRQGQGNQFIRVYPGRRHKFDADILVTHRRLQLASDRRRGEDRDLLAQHDRRLVPVQRGHARSRQNSRLALVDKGLEPEVNQRRVRERKRDPSVGAVEDDVPETGARADARRAVEEAQVALRGGIDLHHVYLDDDLRDLDVERAEDLDHFLVLGRRPGDQQRVGPRIYGHPHPRHRRGHRRTNGVYVAIGQVIGDGFRDFRRRGQFLRRAYDEVLTQPAERQAAGLQDEATRFLAGHVQQTQRNRPLDRRIGHQVKSAQLRESREHIR